MDHDDAFTHSEALTSSRKSKCREQVRRTRYSRKLHQCPHCSYCTKYDANTLLQHIRTHTDEKPYSCKECGQRFKHSSNRAAHMRTMHSTGQATLHQCPHCPYSTKHIVLVLYGDTYVLTQERSHSHVRSVVDASDILQVLLLTCAQHTLLNKLHCISALTVLTLPNMVLIVCSNTSVFTQERSHTHVRSVGSASHNLLLVADIYAQCIQRCHLINSIAIPVPAVPIFWSY